MSECAGRWKDEWNDLPQDMRDFATHVGPTDARVLLLGPPGSGKGYLARILHELSPRADRPFLLQNCGVVTESLAEAQFFGFVKGAYTDAKESRAGVIESAGGGTLFLDEFGALPTVVQPMFLNFLETGQYRRMGSTTVREADVRVIAATNRNLGTAIEKGRFRDDLVSRLSIWYRVPPLCERRREIEGIIHGFLREVGEERGRRLNLAEDAMHRMRNHDWPGNIRELLNVLEYCVVFAEDGLIGRDLVEKGIRSRRLVKRESEEAAASPRPRNDDDMRRELHEALGAAKGKVSLAAKLLGVHRSTVYRRLERFGGPERPE